MDNTENTTIIEISQGDTRQDALGDMPQWDNFSLKEIIKLCYYWQKDTDGRYIPRPCEWKDGNTKLDYNKLNNGDDQMTTALRRMAATQKSLLKCGLNDNTINTINPTMDIDEALEHCMKGRKAAFILDAKNRQQELKDLKKEANIQMSEHRSKIPMNELVERIRAFSTKIRDNENKKYEFRTYMANKVVISTQNLTEIKDNKAINTFANKLYWSVITGKDRKNIEEAAEARYTFISPALRACMERYITALKEYHDAENKENNREEPSV